VTPVTIARNHRRKALCAPFARKPQKTVIPNGSVLRFAGTVAPVGEEIARSAAFARSASD
jgi:hypothetical protein